MPDPLLWMGRVHQPWDLPKLRRDREWYERLSKSPDQVVGNMYAEWTERLSAVIEQTEKMQ